MNKRQRPHLLVYLAIVIASILYQTPALAAEPWLNLSGPMQTNGNVDLVEISPDGQYVVFTADKEKDGVHDLYSVPLIGGDPVRLSHLLESDERDTKIDHFSISPDSKRVVFICDQDTLGQEELYSVPIAGPITATVKLNKTLPEDADLWHFLISQDSQTVVYSADQDKYKTNELYAVPIAGPASAGTKLNGPLTTGGNAYTFQISPDSKTVVYRSDQEIYDKAELFSVPIDRSAEPVKINEPLIDDGDVAYYEIDPLSKLVVYKASKDDYSTDELFVAPIRGPASAGYQISPQYTGRGIDDFSISPDGRTVVFTAVDGASVWPKLYSVPIDGPGSQAVELSIPLSADGSVFSYMISPDSGHVVYKLNQATDVQYEIFSVPITGPASASVKLNEQLGDGKDVWFTYISADSSLVVYNAQLADSKNLELYSVPIAGPASAKTKLNGPLVDGAKSWYFELSPDGDTVAYLADADVVGTNELFVAPIAGPSSTAKRVSGPMAPGGDGAIDVWYAPDSQHLVYLATQESPSNRELFVTIAASPEVEAAGVYLPALLCEP